MFMHGTATIDGAEVRLAANQLLGGSSHFLRGFIYPRWLAGFLPICPAGIAVSPPKLIQKMQWK